MLKNKIINHIFRIFVLFLFMFLVINCVATTGGYGSGATVSDAFNSAAGFGITVLNADTERKKQQNDQFLNQVKVNLSIESNNYIRSLSSRNDYRNFINDWYVLRDYLYVLARQQNSSGYVKDNLQIIFMDNDMQVLGKVGDIAHNQWQEDGSPGQSTSKPYKQLPNY